MKKRFFMVLALMLAFCLTAPPAMAKHYQEELAANVTIDAEIDETIYDNLKQFIATWPRVSDDGECDELKSLAQSAAALLFHGDIAEAEMEVFDDYCVIIDTDTDYMLYAGQSVAYYSKEADRCYWHIAGNVSDELAPSPVGVGNDNFYGEDYSLEDFQTEHDYMSFEEADELARSLIQACAGSDRLQPVLRCSYSLTHEQLPVLREIILENVEYYGKLYPEKLDFDDWSEADDYYILHYTYTFDGAPVYDHSYNIPLKGMDAPGYTSYFAECHINRNGVCELYAEYIIPDEEDEPQSAMTTDEAVQALRDYFSETYVSIPVEITGGHIEYLPQWNLQKPGSRVFIPVWTFTADLLTTVGRYENAKSYQFNAITGEPLSWS